MHNHLLYEIYNVNKYFSELDLLPFLVTFLLSFWEVQYGIVGGVLVSGFMLLYIMARPKVKVSLKSLYLMNQLYMMRFLCASGNHNKFDNLSNIDWVKLYYLNCIICLSGNRSIIMIVSVMIVWCRFTTLK